MRTIALSTMFAQQERFDDGAAFARFAAESGYRTIEVSHSTDETKLRAIVGAGAVSVGSIHQPAPHVRLKSGASNAELNLAALEEGERAMALRHALASIEWAERVGAKALVVHLGAVEGGSWPEGESELYGLYNAGESATQRYAEVRTEMAERRAAAAAAHLSAARRSLEALVAEAAPRGIAIGLENRLHYHEIPHPAECLGLLAGIAPHEAGFWHDTGHAEVLDRLGFMPHQDWFDALGERLLGAHVHDVRGVVDHRAPGTGELDWAMVAKGLSALDRYTLEIDQREPDDAVRAASGFLAGIGLG